VSSILLDPRGSGQLFFMFIRPHPYTCLGIDLLEILGIECCSIDLGSHSHMILVISSAQFGASPSHAQGKRTNRASCRDGNLT